MMQLRVRAARANRFPVVGSMLLCVAVLIGACALPQSASATDGFDFPVGYPDGAGWNRGFCSNVENPNCDNDPCGVDALDFLEWNDYSGQTGCVRHPGEDWNKDCGGNCDCGEDVHAIADGVVVSVSDDCSWGATIIRHDNVPGFGTLWSVYGHMEHSNFAVGLPVSRGDIIGSVAMKGATFCHLHFEIRRSDLGACFFPNEQMQGADPRAWVMARYLNPTAFIASHRPSTWTVVNLHPTGTTSSEAWSVEGGQQVGAVTVNGVDHASLWYGSGESWVDLHPAGASASRANGVSGGQQVGQATFGPPGNYHASLWSGSAESWIDLHPVGAHYSIAHGVSAGQQVGEANLSSFPQASLWSGSAESFMSLRNGFSYAYGVNGDQQVGNAEFAGYTHAILWNGSADSLVDLHPPSCGSFASAISGGQQAGSTFFGCGPSGYYHACMWRGSAASWVDLNPLGASQSYAVGVHGGQQAGIAVVNGVSLASLWGGTAASWVNLHVFLPPNYASSGALGIWHDGAFTYVVGSGFNSTTGRNEALMWVGPLPCPADFNADGLANSQDFFDFLAAFFSLQPAADFNNDTFINSQDFFDFLVAFFAGC